MTALRRWWLPILLVAVLWIPVLSHPTKVWRMVAGGWIAGDDTRGIEGRFDAWIPVVTELRAPVLWLRSALLHSDEHKAVVRGQDGLLFYRSEGANDGHSFDDLRGEVPLDPASIAALRSELRRRRSLLASWGGRYLVAVVPNKEAVLTASLPLRERPAAGARTRLDQLLAALDPDEQAGLLDLRPALVQAGLTHPELPRYWTFDSHWTSWGARVAVTAITDHLQAQPPSVPDARGWTVTVGPVVEHTCDMARLLLHDGLPLPQVSERHTVAPPDPAPVTGHDIPQTVTIPIRGGHLTPWSAALARVEVHQPEAPRAGHLVVLHDSYGTFGVTKELAKPYQRATFIWSHGFDEDELARLRPTLVVHLVISRYLDVLRPAR